MAITTVDGAVAGALAPIEWQKQGVTMEAINQWYSLWYSNGVPGAGAAPTSGINGAVLSAPVSGQIPFANPGVGNTYLMRLGCHASQVGTLLLCDRLWDNSSIAVASGAQAITTPTWPARDRLGGTDGVGVLLGIEVSVATGNGSAISTTTATYTNSGGTGSRTATLGTAVPSIFPATATVGTFVPMQLAAGDVGVKSIQSFNTGTTYSSGTVHLVAYRPLARLGVPVANAAEAAIDLITGGAVRLYNDSVPFLIWIPSATTALSASGQIIFTQG